MTIPTTPLLWLNAGDVQAALPPLEERLRLAEVVMTALAVPGGAQLPPKVGVAPRDTGSFTDAMPAWLRGMAAGGASGAGAADDPAADLLGIKWVTVFPGNNDHGLPAIGATVILNDPHSGLPVAILDGGPITAHRTAAVSGVILRRWGPRVEGVAVRSPRVALIGAGAQGQSHLPVLAGVLPGCHIVISDVDAGRAGALRDRAATTPGIAEAIVAASPREAIDGADAVVTVASFGPIRQVMTNDWLTPHATVVPVDYATYCSAEVARTAALWLVDEKGQFLHKRDEGHFDSYPDPGLSIGEAILANTPRPEGRVVGTHLGVGLSDVVFGDAIVRRARQLGLGTELAR